MLYLQWWHFHALPMPCSMPAFQRASGEVLLQKYKDYLARLMENAVMFETCLQASCVVQTFSGAAQKGWTCVSAAEKSC